MTLNLAVLLEESAKERPEKVALVVGGREISYSALRDGAGSFAGALSSMGVGPGDRVALMVPNVPQFVVAYYAILATGASVVPLNVLLKGPEVTYHLDDSTAKVIVAWEGFLDEARKGFAGSGGTCESLVVVESPDGSGATGDEGSFEALLREHPPKFDACPTMPDDTAVVIYTSGTTGRPKGAELTHANMFMNAMCNADKLLKMEDDDVAIAVLPLFHIFGQTCVMNATIYRGGTMVLVPRFDPGATLEAIQSAGVTVFSGVPTMYQYLLRYPGLDEYDTSSLRIGVSGGASMPVEVMKAFEERFGIVILEGYGLSESSPTAIFNRSVEERKVGSIGLPIWGTGAKVADANGAEAAPGERGELALYGHHIMKGYLNRPEATAEAIKNGWFHTGDIATMDKDGYFYIVDRVKDMVIRGGYNVYPREVEEALYQHPGVAEVAVIGIPHEELGEEVAAVVAMKDGESATEEEMISFAKDRVASYKYPRSVAFIDELPKTATGKILKRELTKGAAEAAESAQVKG